MDKYNIYLFVLFILSLIVTVTVILPLMLVNKANNQKYKERTLNIIEEEVRSNGEKNIYQYTLFQVRKTKIEVKACEFENEVKIVCSYVDLPYDDDNKIFFDFLDELKIQPGNTTSIDWEEFRERSFSSYFKVYNFLNYIFSPYIN